MTTSYKNWMSLLFAAFLATATAAAAQQPPPAPGQNRPGDNRGDMRGRPMGDQEDGPMAGPGMDEGLPGEEMEILGFGEAPGEEDVKSVPYSAKVLTERTHVLADGNRIHKTTESVVYRDGEGRVRREITLPAGGPMNQSGKERSFIFLRDPGTRSAFILMPDRKIARRLPERMQENAGPRRERFQEMRKKMEASGEVKTESLGTKTIAGVPAEGKRMTRTIPAGKIGNDKPIEITNEVWFSKELHAVVLLKRNDPRSGSTTYQLTDIQRKDPDPKLFQVPPDYQIREGGDRMRERFGGRGFRGRRGPGGGMEGPMGGGPGQRPGPEQQPPSEQDF